VLHLRNQLQERYSFHHIISKNSRMHAIFELISNVAHTTSTVLIEGETGTGKELIAQAIHHASAQDRSGPFIAVNGAALPDTLLESELFGHEKGAFTGAAGQRPGRFEMADGGTLFLDELDAMPLAIQPKLLRVLQEREFERVGGTEKVQADVRFIAATGRRLARLVKDGSFRKDLYYRVNVVRIALPPLRKRPEDVPLLAAHFAAKFANGEAPKSITPQAMEIMLNYNWPGNVRQLENVIERACVIARSNTIEPAHLPPELGNPHRRRTRRRINLDRPLPELLRENHQALEREYIQAALAKAGGNVTRSARICRLSRRSLTAKIAAYQIDAKTLRAVH
jgi:transcriptional regulator with PAS, ATPase and Fis domain